MGHSTLPKLGIIAGGGLAPGMLIDACRAQGRPFHVLAVSGHADPEIIGDAPVDWIKVGQAGSGFGLLKQAGVAQVVMIGHVTRPTLSDLTPDLRTAAFFARIGLKSLGDDGVLRAVVAEFESEGFTVLGLDDILADCLAPVGQMGRIAPDAQALADIERGCEVAKGLGALDVGQAVVVQQGIVLGVEAIEGTEKLLDRVGGLARSGPGGVLVKAKKPRQDGRVDLPAVGVKTVLQAHRAGLRGIAVEAGGTLMLGREQIVAEADLLGLFVTGIAAQDAARAEAAASTPVFYIIAGEASGDALGAALMAALRRRLGDHIRFFGIGGAAMSEQGLSSLFPMAELSVMGLAEVLPRIPHILGRLRQTIDHIGTVKPTAVITIDSWGFCGRVQKHLKQTMPSVKRLHYVAPMVWAWKAKRAKHLAHVLDGLLTLLPFEPPWFTREGLPTTFVGHPVIEQSFPPELGAQFRAEHGIPDGAPIVLLLPGSRRNETARLLPVYAQVARSLAALHPDVRLVVPTVAGVAREVTQAVNTWGVPVVVVEGLAEKRGAFAAARVALAASGSVTLELAMARVPVIVAYKLSPVSAYVATKFLGLKLRYISLVNILADKPIIPEYIQSNCRPEALVKAIEGLLVEGPERDEQIRNLTQAMGFLGLGGASPSDRAADAVLKATGFMGDGVDH